MKIKWNEEMLNRCWVEDKLPSELFPPRHTEQSKGMPWEDFMGQLGGEQESPPAETV